MTEIYHDKQPMFGLPDRDKVWPDDFNLVATIESDNLDLAFEKTNTIDHPWWENAEVTPTQPRCRSTSVGDVIVNSQDVVFLCLPVGWKEIGKADKKITITSTGWNLSGTG